MVTTTHVKFSYPPELLHQPVIYRLGKQFNVVTNTRCANVSDAHGWVYMELQGDPSNIQHALDWAYQHNFFREPDVIAAADSAP